MFRSLPDHHQGDTILVLTSVTKTKSNNLQNKSRNQIPIQEEAISQHQLIPSTSTSSPSV